MNRVAMNRWVQRLRRNRSGAVAIEFAFIAPVLFAIILGTIDLGRFAWTLSTVQMAADEAARQGAVQNKATSAVETQAENNLLGMDPGNFTVVASNVVISGANFLRVNITRTYNFMLPISLVMASHDIDVTSEFPKP